MFKAALIGARRRLLLFSLIVIAGLVGWHYLPLGDWLDTFSTLLQQLGPLAPLFYALFYVLATLILVPLAPLAIAAGYLFGLQQAFVVTLLAATVGALAAFLLSRHLLSRSCRELMQPYPTVMAVEHSIAAQGWLIVFLLRLSPVIPSHLLNYLCGITDIALHHYTLATFFGKAPLILLLSYIGASAAQLQTTASPSPYLHLLLYGAGLLFTLLACWLVGRRARRELANKGLRQ
ncbi:putative membrane protein YdjX (TVP38/TMEM64 family) [Methylohalomonas lacus]|uniref:TVP38/TMEM64 family membrane protein n=1 Tax=Methylohalomonas lacus TaxID=398773 RepID=A0AAE3L4P9_9GAMM|nr:TVP38/TMEM64 family protein [Methylohalomonas lacus]MCS3904238.1 putative membrane protein YdjX (TVP38/TMEM64 family) [Methylohalomonas lacus]